MSSKWNQQSPIVWKMRTGQSDDPFIEIVQKLPIDDNGGIILDEVPSEFHRVEVKSIGKTWIEIQSGTPDNSQYKVDYNGHKVEFHPSNSGLVVDVKYYGRGSKYIPASQVYTKVDNNEVQETVGSIIEDGRRTIDELGQFDEKMQEIDSATTSANSAASEANANATFAQTQGEFAKTTGENLAHKGDYNNTVAYRKGNIVDYAGNSFICMKNASAGINPSNDEYWNQIIKHATTNDQTWTATANQTVFTITNGSYAAGMKHIDVWVGGVPQSSGSGFTETNSTSFTLSEGVPAGTRVYAKWFEGATSIEKKHFNSHHKGGSDEIDITQLRKFDEAVTAPLAHTEQQIETLSNDKNSTLLTSRGYLLSEKPRSYMSWPFGTGFYDESNEKFGLFVNGKSTHTSTDGAIYFILKDPLSKEIVKEVKVAENSGKGTITHAGGITSSGDYLCIAKITIDGNEVIEKSVIYRSNDKGTSWTEENFVVDGQINPVFDGYGGVFKLRSGELLTYARELNGSAWYVLKSTDNGYSWRKIPLENPLISENSIFREAMEGNAIEMTDGTLMYIIRTRLMTRKNTKDAAIITYSYDKGESWTPMKKSSTWLDMSSNNCAMISHPNSKTIEIVFGSRFEQPDGKGSLFQTIVTEDQAKNDMFPTPSRIYQGGTDGDFGYPCLIKSTKTNVVNLFYYNKDKNGGTNIYWADGVTNATILNKVNQGIDDNVTYDDFGKAVIKDAYFLREFVDLSTIKHSLPLRHLFYLRDTNIKLIYDSVVTPPLEEISLDVPQIMGLPWLSNAQAYLVEVMIANKNTSTPADWNEVAIVTSTGQLEHTSIGRSRVVHNGTHQITQQLVVNTVFRSGKLGLWIRKPGNIDILKVKLLGFYII